MRYDAYLTTGGWVEEPFYIWQILRCHQLKLGHNIRVFIISNFDASFKCDIWKEEGRRKERGREREREIAEMRNLCSKETRSDT